MGRMRGIRAPVPANICDPLPEHAGESQRPCFSHGVVRAKVTTGNPYEAERPLIERDYYMAITKEQVFDAADSLEQMGTEPTYLHVRMHLGSGSFSTIQKYLRQWKETRGDAGGVVSESDVPEVLLSAARGFARDAWRVAQSSIARKTAALREELEQQNISAVQDAEAASRMVDTLQAKLEELRATHADDTSQIATLREQLAEGERRRVIAETALERMSDEHTRTSQHLEIAHRELEEKNRTVGALQSANDRYRETVERLQHEVTELRAELAAERSRFFEQQQNARDSQSQRESLSREVAVLKENLLAERGRYDVLSGQLNRLSELVVRSTGGATAAASD